MADKSLQEFLDTTLLKTPQNYIQNLLKTVHSKNITMEDWNMFVQQLDALIRQDREIYNGFKATLVDLQTFDYGFAQTVASAKDEFKQAQDDAVAEFTELKDIFVEDYTAFKNDADVYLKLLKDTVLELAPLEAGTAEFTIIQTSRTPNQAITENSIALGEGSIAGVKGYYFTEIFYGNASTNPQVRIQTYQPRHGLHISPYALHPDPTFVEPDYMIPNYSNGDVFNLICNDHFALFGNIVSITNDVISFTGDIDDFKTRLALQVSYGHAEMSGDYYINLYPSYDDYTLCVPEKPLEGYVEVCKTAFSSGRENISAGEFGDSWGKRTKVIEAYGHTEGVDTIAGYAAHGEGDGCEALAKYSHAQNKDTKANAYAGTSMGIETVVEEGADGGVATGYKTHARKKYTFTGGDRTEADAEDAVAFGNQTTASALAAFAEGLGFGGAFGIEFGPSEASGVGSHVEGIGTKAMHEGAHAENFGTEARAKATHAGGLGSIASGYAAFIHAMFGLASGSYSAAFNYYTIASAFAQFVAGMYNKENPDALFIVGNGTSETDRSNAFEVFKDGTINARNNLQVVTGTVNMVKSHYKVPDFSNAVYNTVITDTYEIPLGKRPLAYKIFDNIQDHPEWIVSDFNVAYSTNGAAHAGVFTMTENSIKYRGAEYTQGEEDINDGFSTIVRYMAIVDDVENEKCNTLTLVDTDGYSYGPYYLRDLTSTLKTRCEYYWSSGDIRITFLYYLNDKLIFASQSYPVKLDLERGLSETYNGEIVLPCEPDEVHTLSLDSGKNYKFYIVGRYVG